MESGRNAKVSYDTAKVEVRLNDVNLNHTKPQIREAQRIIAAQSLHSQLPLARVSPPTSFAFYIDTIQAH